MVIGMSTPGKTGVWNESSTTKRSDIAMSVPAHASTRVAHSFAAPAISPSTESAISIMLRSPARASPSSSAMKG